MNIKNPSKLRMIKQTLRMKKTWDKHTARGILAGLIGEAKRQGMILNKSEETIYADFDALGKDIKPDDLYQFITQTLDTIE